MKFLERYMRMFVKLALLASMLAPALTWAHGAVDTPVARQVHCRADPNLWTTPIDMGCRAVGTFPAQQWNEIAHLVKDYNNQSAIEAAIPDGQLCGAGRSQLDKLNTVQSTWYKTAVVPVNGTMKVRLLATAKHTPSFVRIYLSKPGYSAARSALKWSDLELIHSETINEFRPNPSNPVQPASDYAEFQVNVPAGRSGDAVLFTRWQRIDPAGEGFYNCSDITLGDVGEPAPWPDLGQFISPAIPPQVNVRDKVHFRIMGNSKSGAELVDIKVVITEQNRDPNKWGMEIARQVNAAIAKIGKRQGSNVVFDPNDFAGNNVFVSEKGYTFSLSIDSDSAPPVDQRPPIARVDGPDTVKSGQTIAFNGNGSTGHNGALDFKWRVSGMTGADTAATFSGVAPNVANPTQSIARLTVHDKDNNKTAYVDHRFVITPAGDGGGGDYPAYVPGTAYKAGDKVSNRGGVYQCKPFPASGWCSQSPTHYAPGAGSDWQDAWDKL